MDMLVKNPLSKNLKIKVSCFLFCFGRCGFVKMYRRILFKIKSNRGFASKDHLNFIKEVKGEKLQRPGRYGRTPTEEKIGIGGYLLLSGFFVVAINKIKLLQNIIVLAPITTLGLGIWQVQRKQWKEDLIKNLESKLSLEPVPLPEK